jgi:PhnB protein
MTVNFKAEGFHAITPYVITHDTAAAIDFYKAAFGATELYRLPGPNGSVMHAEIKIGDSPLMLSDGCSEMGTKTPKDLGGSPISIMIYTEDVDTMFAQAIAAGGTLKKGVEDQFYGDRSGMLDDPFGHTWTIATHIEDVPPEEIDRRFQEMMKQMGGCEKS